MRTRYTGLTPSSTNADGVATTQAAVARVERDDLHPLPGRAPPVQLGRGDQLTGGRVEQLGVPGDALAHRRPGTDDVQRGGLEPAQQLVEVDVAGGRAGERGAPLVGLLEVADGQVQQVADGLRGVDDPPVGQLEHLRLGQVEGLGDVVGLVVAELGDLAGHADEAAQQGGVLHDAGVAGRVARWPAWPPAARRGAAAPPMASSRLLRRSSSATVTTSTGSPTLASTRMASNTCWWAGL